MPDLIRPADGRQDVLWQTVVSIGDDRDAHGDIEWGPGFRSLGFEPTS
jgi:hypothetical protein